ncbi:HNH endonuclease signature motif containing protein [Corynebacterium sp. H127]|uniref:HNH endonuclease signature motif containing protein n=1 Tax=Corynebacterium sp. H127 TaxID=3133418 RepID=UPI0030B4CDA0
MFSEFAAAHAHGMAILADCARLVRLHGISELAAQSGLPESTIRAQAAAHKQLGAHAALATGIPVDNLILVSRWSKKVLPDEIPILLQAVHGASYAEAEDHLRAAVRELTKGSRQRPPRGTVAVAKRADFWNRRRITFYLSDAEYAQLRADSQAFVDEARKKDETLTHGQALHQWLTRKLTTPGQQSEHSYKPVLLMPVDSSLAWDRGHLVTADGARVNPLELLKAQLEDTGWALQTALDDDGVAHAITVARIQNTRNSTGEHRMIAALETLVCAWPGCHRVAAECQAHHIQAFREGGETSWDNVTPLCAVHNGMNDDVPERVANGRIVRGNGGYPGRQRRPGDPVRYSANDLLTSGWRGLTYDYYAATR